MRRALALLGLLLAPAAAWADPITLVAALAPYIGGAAAAAVVTYAGQALLVGLYVYGAARARRKARAAQAKARAEYNANLQDRSITALQALPTWRIVPGRCITGGDIHAIFTTDKTGYREDGTTYTRPDALKHLVIVFADHEIAEFHEFYLDGVAVGPLDGNGYCTGGEFYSARTDSRIAYLEGDGTVTVPQPVVSVLNAYVQTGYGEYYDVTDVSGSISLASGNTVINGPANAVVNYLVQADLGSVRIQQHLGTASQAVDSYLNGILPSKWTSTDRLLGKAYIVLTLDLENQRFQGAPPGITADISGRKVYDPRKDSTVAGGSGSQRNNDANTWAWSDNPALAVRDYITAEWGVAAAQADVNEAYVIAAANACDARSSAAAQSKADAVTASASADTITFAAEQPYTVGDGVRFTTTGTLPGGLSAGTTYYLVRGRDLLNYGLATSVANAYAGTTLDITSAGTGTHTCTFYDYAAYKCNGAFNVQDGQREAVLDDLCESMGGNAWEGAQWEVVAAAWTATVMDLGDDDLAGQIEIVQADTPLEQLCNGVRGTFIPAGKSVPVEFDNYSNATFVSDDGQEHWDDIALPFVDTRFRARNLCRIRVETGRNGQIIRYPAKLKAWPLQRGDRVRVSSTEYGLSLKTYRVTDWQDAPTAVVLTLQEDEATAYDLADAATSDATPNTGLGSPWVVQGIGTLTCASGVGTGLQGADGSWQPRVQVSWIAATDPYLADGAGRVVIAWRAPRSLEWLRQEMPSDAITTYLDGVREGDPLVIEAAYRNALGAYGPPSFASHTVTITQSAGGYGTLTLIAHGVAGAVAIVGNSARKIASDGAWDAGVYSKAPIAGACEVSFVVPQTDKALMIGLNSDPTTDAGYASIDFAIYPRTDGRLYIEESGSTVYDGGASSYAAGDTLTVRNRGPVIEYLRNATVVRRKEVAMNATLSLDSSFYNVGALATNLVFRALTPVPAQYRVSSIGYRFTTTPPTGYPGTLENVELGATAPGTSLGRSFNVATISRMTGLVTSFNSYDVFADTANATAMAAALNALDSTVVVVVWSYDEPQGNHLFGTLPAAMYRCGASHLVYDNLRYRSAYILIGIPGMGVGAGFEAYGGSVSDSTTDAYARASFQITQQGELVVNGQTFGDLLPGVITSDMLATALAADIDGKIVSYWQASAPGTATEGDLWYDTDDNYKVYRWTSGSWVLAADSRIATAISNAATAQSTADGKIVTFVQASTPSATAVGDLWFDSDDGYKLYRAGGTGTGSWTAYQFGTSALDPNARGLRRVVNAAASVTISEVIHIPDGYSWNDTIVSDSQFTAAYNGYAVVTFDGTWNTTSGYGQYSVQNTEATYDGWNLRSMSSQTGSIAMTITRTFQLTANTTYTFAALGAKISSGSTDAVLNGQLLVEVTYTG